MSQRYSFLRRQFLTALPFAAVPLLGQSAPPAAAPPDAGPAATPPKQDSPEFATSTTEVIVPVTVTDDKGRFVTDLDKSDFVVYDEGQPQTITFFSRERSQPVVVGFLIDLSNRNRLYWDKYKEACKELIFALLPGDNPRFSGYLVTYADRADLQVNTTQQPNEMAERIDKIKPGGGSAMYDAIYLGCTSRSLVKGEPLEPRRVIVIVGDGHDNNSKYSLNQIIEIAQKNLTTIYGVSTTAFGFSSDADGDFRRMCEETGGRVVYPLQDLYKDTIGFLSKPSDEGNYAIKVGTGGYAAEIAKGLFSAIGTVVGEVTTQYIIRYVPAAQSGEKKKPFRNVRVEVPKYGNAKVRSRKGYYSIN